MKSLDIIKELENNPKLITEKLLEINNREAELNILVGIHDNTTTNIIRALQHLKLDAIKHTKLVGKLKLSLQDKESVRAELTAIKYFKDGTSLYNIEKGLEKTKASYVKAAQVSLTKLGL